MNLFLAKSLKSYITARIRLLPGNGRGEASRIAKHLGVSTTLVSQILSGDRSLNPEQGERLADYLALNPLETEFFLFLIQYERAGTPKLREFWQGKLEKLRADSRVISHRIEVKRILNEQERAVFYSSPLYAAIRLFTSTAESGKTIEEIAARFDLSRAKTGKFVSFLVETSLVVAKDGRFTMGAQSTHLESTSPHLTKHHANWRIKAIQYADDLEESELMFTSPASLSKEDFARLREAMLVFIQDFLATARASPAEEVACFNMDFFWLRK